VTSLCIRSIAEITAVLHLIEQASLSFLCHRRDIVMKENVERIVNNAMNYGMAVCTRGYIFKFPFT
jgi:hypothetical protein